MNETDEYILQLIKTMVWSGFYAPADVDAMIDDVLEEDADEAMLRAAVAPEFAKKAGAETGWPAKTDCDRFDAAFGSLNAQGIVALHNAGFTMSDGLGDVSEAVRKRGRGAVKGYCFYHGQDVERVVAGEALTIAFGDLDDDSNARRGVGESVRDALQQQGLTVDWNGDANTRLNVQMDWKRRGPPKG